MGTIAGENITAVLEFDDNVTASVLQHRFPEVDTAGSGMEIFGTEGAGALVERGGLDSARTRTSGPTASTTGGSRSRQRSRTGSTPTA